MKSSIALHGLTTEMTGTPAPIRLPPSIAGAVGNEIDVLRSGIDACLLGLGKSHVNELTPDDVTAPEGFFRTLGA